MNTTQEIIDDFYAGKSEDTVRAYRKDLQSFAQYLGSGSIKEAVEIMLSLPESQASLTVMHYRTKLQESGLGISSINRRISTIRSLLKRANASGIINWLLDVKNLKDVNRSSKPKIDVSNVRALFSALTGQKNSKKAIRDLAILRLLYDLALKRNSVAQLDMNDLRFKSGMIFPPQPNGCLKKAKRLPPITKKALKNWVNIRGNEPGPLFVNFDHAGKGKRLSSTSIYRIVKAVGKKVGLSITPDELRQLAIKEALKTASRLGIEDKDVLTLTDHKSIASLKRYRKTRESIQETLSISISEQN